MQIYHFIISYNFYEPTWSFQIQQMLPASCSCLLFRIYHIACLKKAHRISSCCLGTKKKWIGDNISELLPLGSNRAKKAPDFNDLVSRMNTEDIARFEDRQGTSQWIRGHSSFSLTSWWQTPISTFFPDVNSSWFNLTTLFRSPSLFFPGFQGSKEKVGHAKQLGVFLAPSFSKWLTVLHQCPRNAVCEFALGLTLPLPVSMPC